MKQLAIGLGFFISATSMIAPLVATGSATEVRQPRARIHPSIMRVLPNGQQQFRVSTMHARLEAATVVHNVKWSVNEVIGGSPEFGIIDANGLYTAPAKTPAPSEIHIGAEVEGVANRYVWATVSMGSGKPSYRLVRAWGEPVSKLERLRSPHGVTISPKGEVIVADEGSHRVIRYSSEGKFLGEVGYGFGREPGQFTKPRHTAVDADGHIWVSDEKSDRPRLQVFSADGEFSRILGEKGTAPGMLLRAHGMQFDRQQRLFVVDVDNARVSVYDRSGKFLFDWGKDGLYPGEFNAAHGLFIDPSGDVFISGYYGPVQKFTADGKFLLAFGFGEPPDGPVHFHAIGGDRWGNVYVTVRNLGHRPNEVSIVKYNNNGDFITSWLLSKAEREVNWVTTDHRGLVYAVYDSKSHVGVEVFQPE
ncbi:MAG: NHL repeat-containing protein [Bryobacteraceae bacterium]